MKPEIGQVRAAASSGNGEMFILVVGHDRENTGWEAIVIHSTKWYSNMFVVGSTTWWSEDWLTTQTVAI